MGGAFVTSSVATGLFLSFLVRKIMVFCDGKWDRFRLIQITGKIKAVPERKEIER